MAEDLKSQHRLTSVVATTTSGNDRHKMHMDMRRSSETEDSRELRRKRMVLTVAVVAAIIFLLAVLMVGIGLKMNTYIDSVMRKENEMQTYVFTNDNVTMMILNDNGEIQVNATSLNDTST